MQSTSKPRRAYEVALANRDVPDGTELDEAIATATNIVDLAPLALATMKRFVTGHISCRKALPSCQLASPPSSRRAQQRGCCRRRARAQGTAPAAIQGKVRVCVPLLG
jgi:hypothetical protein